MYEIPLNNTTIPLVFLLVDATDDKSGLTGKAGSVVVEISKNGGAFAAPAGAISEIGGNGNGRGYYKVAPNATDAASIGPVVLYAKDAASDEAGEVFSVVAQLQIKYGTVVAGSTGSAVILSGLPAGKRYEGQRLAQLSTDEARIVATQSFDSGTGQYTLNFTGTAGTTTGPFSAVTTGEAMWPLP